MSASTLLDRLQNVRSAGDGKWTARCPAHEDRSPSLSIRELPDGRVLVHDFGGCPATDVLDAVGLNFADLYPERAIEHGRPVKANHYHAARLALQTITKEVLLVAIAAENLGAGIALTKVDRDRLIDAAVKIRQHAELVR